MGTLCPALFNVIPKVPVSIIPNLTEGIPTTQQLWTPSITLGKKRCSSKSPPNNKVSVLSLSIKSELGRKQTCHGKAFLGAQKEGKSTSTTPPWELGWAEEPGLDSDSTRQQLQPKIIMERWDSFWRQVLGDQLGSQVPEKVQKFTLISCLDRKATFQVPDHPFYARKQLQPVNGDTGRGWGAGRKIC